MLRAKQVGQEKITPVFPPTRVITGKLFPTQDELEKAIGKKGDRYLLTFQALWYQLNKLKLEETHTNKAYTEDEYETLATKGMDIGTQIPYLEKILADAKVKVGKEDIRAKLIQILSDNSDKSLIKTAIQDFFDTIKEDSKAPKLDTSNLDYALSYTGTIGYVWSFFGYADEAFFKQLSKTFYANSRIDINEEKTEKQILEQKETIEHLSIKFKQSLLNDPISKLDSLLIQFKTELFNTTKNYKEQKLGVTIKEINSSLTARATTIIEEYKKELAEIQEKLQNYPDSFKKQVESQLKEFKDKNKITESLIASKKSLLSRYEELSKNIALELNNKPGSKKQDLDAQLKAITIPISNDAFPNTKSIEVELKKLQDCVSAPKQAIEAANKNEKDNQNEINDLSSRVSTLAKTLNDRHDSLKPLLEDLAPAVTAFAAAAKSFGLSDEKAIDELSIDLNYESNLLERSIQEHSKNITQFFEFAISQAQASCKNVAPIRKLLNEAYQNEINSMSDKQKPNTLEATQKAWAKALEQLPIIINKRISDYKAQLEKIRSDAISRLAEQGKIELLKHYEVTLAKLNQEIKKISGTLQSDAFKLLLNKKNEEEFVTRIANENHIDELRRNHLRAQQELADKTKALEEAKDQSTKVAEGLLTYHNAATENERLLAQKAKEAAERGAKRTAAKLERKLKQIERPKANNDQINYSKGFLAGFITIVTFFPAWIYGLYRIGRGIQQISELYIGKTASILLGIASAIVSAIIFPISLFYGGASLGYKAAVKGTSSSPENTPLLSLDEPDSPSQKKSPEVKITGITLPPLSIEEQVKLICTKNQFGCAHLKDQLYVQTKPKRLIINNNKMFVEVDENNKLQLGTPATNLVKRILNVVESPDIKIDLEAGYLTIKISRYNKTNTFYISPRNGSDSGLMYVNKSPESNTKTTLTPELFNDNEKLLKILYPVPTPKPSQTHTPNSMLSATTHFSYRPGV